MHLVKDEVGSPITAASELRDYFADAGKPRDQWRVGTEHEMCGVHRSTGVPPAYDGADGIGALLESLAGRGWEPVHENGATIALVRGDSQVTIEPGGQLEHAARPVVSAADLAGDVRNYVAEVCAPSRTFDIAWLAVGFRPFGTRDQVPWMPKVRYDIMREYLPARGRLAHDMMLRTATVQVNLDYADADDARAKMRCAMSVTSLLTALYANSPIVDGADSGFQTYRGEIWRFTDPDRCGLLPFVFEDGDIFAQYAEWALDVPMFFVHRGTYRPAGRMTFRQFLTEGWNGQRATLDDWALHLSTLFPEARMKKFIEVRGCDASTIPMILALGPLCRGLLYSSDARDAATALTAGLDMGQRIELVAAVAREGLRARVPGMTAAGKPVLVGDLAAELVDIARHSLATLDPTELPFLEPVMAIAESRRTRADEVRELWSRHAGDRASLIEAISYPELTRC